MACGAALAFAACQRLRRVDDYPVDVPTSATVVHGIVISPGSRDAFVSIEGVGAEPGKVDVLDLASLERVGSVEAGQHAGGIAFWTMEAWGTGNPPFTPPASRQRRTRPERDLGCRFTST